VEPTLGPLSTGISEFYRYQLTGSGYDAMRLREIQDWVVVPRLLQVAGVADVTYLATLTTSRSPSLIDLLAELRIQQVGGLA